jgi:N-acetylglucosamine-6-phosphate deacetylase
VTSTVLASGALCPPGPPAPGWVRVEDGRIVEVGEGRPPGPATDLGDAVLAPAFVDLQVNGVGDVDLATADPSSWARLGADLGRRGVAAYLATLVSAPRDTYGAALDRAAAARAATGADGAVPLGVHLEGPFLGGAPGAHPVELLGTADLAWMTALLAAHPGLVRMVTLAPEADPGLHLTRWLADQGVLVALGHSDATDADARAAAGAGARAVTHLFNGMRPLGHRAPGLVGAALDDARLTPTVIADLVHVDRVALRIAFAATDPIALVSDSVAVRAPVDAVAGAARLPDGRLVGATALLDDAVANLIGLGLPIERVLAASSAVPAALIGAVDRGRLAPGRRADLVALEPATGRLCGAWVGGAPLR